MKNFGKKNLLLHAIFKFCTTKRLFSSGRPSIDEETVDAVRVEFHRSPRKSIRVASNELAIPRSTVHKVLHKRLRFHAYKLQIVQALKPDDHPRRELLLKKFFSALMMTMTT